MALILLVEDESLLRWALKRQLETQGHSVHEAATLAEADDFLKRHRPDVVLLDLNLPDGNGLDFMAAQREALSESVVLVITAVGQVEDAVRAMKLGAADFLPKPMEHADLIAAVERSLESIREKLDAERLRRDAERSGQETVVAEAEETKRVLSVAATVATSPATTVLIQGETGTGKEVVARYIHACSVRSQFPRLVLNCAALPSELIESELFGHEKGAFTDAKAARRGAFELAQGGTLIFDEIGEMPPAAQAKLLRCLEERTIRRVGGTRDIPVDVRVVALTNRNLGESVEKGEFRRDLFYRLNVFPITIPPLRERRDDILALAIHFVTRFGTLFGKVFDGFAEDVRLRLLSYDWPGNVRELRNLMERAAILEPGGTIGFRSLDLAGFAPRFGPEPASGPEPAVPALGGEILPLDEVEFLMVHRAMGACGGNQSAAARLLGVSRDQLRYRIARYRTEGRWKGEDEAPGVDTN